MQLVGELHAKARQFTERRLRPLNMTFPQLAALMALHKEDGISQAKLATSLETDATTAMVLCDSLEKRGWLRRVPDESDRRVNRLFVTDSGRQVYGEARRRLKREDEHMASRLTADEMGRTILALEDLHRTIKGFLEKET